MVTDDNAPLEPLRFSTEDFLPRHRNAIWHEMICRCLIRVEVTRPRETAPFHELAMWQLPGLSIVGGRGSACTASRTSALVADGKDEIMVNVNTTGHATASWLGREVELKPGEAVLVPTAEIGGMRFPDHFDYVNLRIPRAVLSPFVSNLEQALMRPIPASAEALKLMMGYVRLIQDSPVPASADLQRMFALHLQDLLAVAIGATRDAEEIARGRGIGAARLAAIKADIASTLGDGPVKVSEVAARHGISPVYIHKLFAREGTTLTAHVLEQRLLRAHRALSDPALEHQGISAVAYAVGFDDVSYFNRCFRRRFGMTPSDVRAGEGLSSSLP